MTTTPLEYLLGSYFHQDLHEVYGDEWGALDQFIVNDPHRLAGLPEEIDGLLASKVSEGELREYVTAVGAEFRPGGEGGYRGWLTEIARRVREATSG
jgi:hypothetical protein